jgi:hypothetical protein
MGFGGVHAPLRKEKKPIRNEFTLKKPKKFQKPEYTFPERGNVVQERLAAQVDFRLGDFWGWALDNWFQSRVSWGASRQVPSAKEIKHEIGAGILEIHEQETDERAAMMKSISDSQKSTQIALVGMGALFTLTTGALAAYALWPKVKALFGGSARRKVAKTAAKEATEDEKIATERKNYFDWKRDMLMDEIVRAKW